MHIKDRLLIFMLLGLSIAFAPFTESGSGLNIKPAKFHTHRLPKNVIPTNYNITLNFMGKKKDYNGKVYIKVEYTSPPSIGQSSEIKKSSECSTSAAYPGLGSHKKSSCEEFAPNQIVLHMDETVKLTKAKYFQKNDERLESPIKFTVLDHDRKFQMLALTFPNRNKPESEFTLYFEFGFKAEEENWGFLEKSHQHGSGKQRYIHSQFTPSNARFVMPCFDEPEFKSNFSLTILHQKEEKALSNMHLRDELSSPIRSEFKETPMMSLHNLAFFVGKFECYKNPAKPDTKDKSHPLRVCTTTHNIKKVEFAYEVAFKSLTWMHLYTGIRYPLEKLDIVALPEYLYGHSSSWGLAFIRNDLILADEGSGPARNISKAINVAHSVAHQWFGNLIASRWWTHHWITQGLAEFFGLHLIKVLYPEMRCEYLERMDVVNIMIKPEKDLYTLYEGLLAPLVIEEKLLTYSLLIASVSDPDKISLSLSIFQLIENDLESYSLIEIVHELLKKNEDGLIDMNDLEETIQIVKGGDKNYMSKYSNHLKANRPTIVTVSIIGGKDDSEISITQEKLLARPLGLSYLPGLASSPQRPIPIEESKDMARLVIKPHNFKLSDTNNWFKLAMKPGLSTHYLVKYDEQLMERMKKPIEEKTMSAMDRHSLILDVAALVKLKQLPRKSLEKLLSFYSKEDDSLVILAILKAGKINLECDLPSTPAYEAVLRTYDRYKFNEPSEDFVTKIMLEFLLINLVCSGNEQVINDALEKFDSGDKFLEPHLRFAIYIAVTMKGSKKQVKKLEDLLKKTESEDEKSRIKDALQARCPMK